MRLVLRYARPTKSGTWNYRRRLPKDVSETLGQGEFKRRLGDSKQEALRNFPKIDAEFERLVANTRARKATPTTPLEVHHAAQRLAQELAQGVVHVGGQEISGSAPDAADILRDSYLAQFQTDPDTGEPMGVPDVEARAYAILTNGDRIERPAATVADAKRLYIQERVNGEPNEVAKLSRVNRVISHLEAAGIEQTRPLTELTREDARNVRDYMLRDLQMNPATVRRYLNDIRAIINIGVVEFGLRNTVINPFLNLSFPRGVQIGRQTDRNARHPIPDDILLQIRERMSSHAASDLWQIWRIVENTGCRLGEITGLLVSDVHLGTEIPYLDLVFHPHRRLKNTGSIRRVPLIGEALKAVKEAVEAAGESPYLFPRYGRVRGADTASASLMKHLRNVTDDRKLTVHSLRHRMEDRLTLARVEEYDRNLVLGHSKGAMSERYGGPDARLEVAARALKAALKD
ncbi:site-specific integrase [Nitratireductor aquimarinus]|uniref:site-specific integrase n=1 Tax=Nitratireductor aquimarinus TaxID=889300 RepID=UPI00293657DF|nr:site-specific integrase [Nitratireductor aquimarinus]MDV2968642.1 site-specific integrase [Nitratireductor aquimarinus]